MTKKTRRSKARRALLAMSLVLVTMLVTVGGTIAWLTATSQEVTNTFSVGNINVSLDEKEYVEATGTYTENRVQENTYPLIPGSKYQKDPTVRVDDIAEGVPSEDCYLFVQRVVTNNSTPTLVYTENWSGWTKLENETVAGDVYYREVLKSDATKEFVLLTADADGNTVTVDGESLTKENMPTAANAPKLQYKAFAVQKANLDVDAAWGKVSANAIP